MASFDIAGVVLSMVKFYAGKKHGLRSDHWTHWQLEKCMCVPQHAVKLKDHALR